MARTNTLCGQNAVRLALQGLSLAGGTVFQSAANFKCLPKIQGNQICGHGEIRSRLSSESICLE
jgi:hypothetical protein